jgi:F420-non-reducing hydrogenase iron-sulfur subunit
MINSKRRKLALFYCRNVPESQEKDRQALEEACGETISFFPMPCSGRVEPVHLLRALEEFADAAYVIACPTGACRNFEGNLRAKKRMERTKSIIESIGLERERVGLIVCSKETPKPLAVLAREIMDKVSSLGASPALGPEALNDEEKGI